MLERYDKEIEKIYHHKISTIATNCQNYLDKNYFFKQIAYEADKNIHRFTSAITDIINKEIDENK